MASIQIKVPDVSQNIQTSLSQDYNSGTTLNVNSSQGFVSGNYVVIGQPGLENTEVTNLTASPPTNTSLTISALKFSHPKGTPVYYANWDKYELYYRTTDLGAWVVYGSMPASLSFESLYTEYRDSASTATYSWKYRYYSSEKSAYSDYSDIISAAGWGRNSVGYMVREIRKIVNDPDGKTVSDTEIIRFLNAAQDKIYSLYDKWWFLFTNATATSVAGQKAYNLPTNFGRMHSVLFRSISGTSDITYNLEYISMIEYDYQARDNNTQSDDNLKYYAIYPGDTTSPPGYLKLFPPPATAGLTITMRYYKLFTDLATYADTTELPIPDVLENYAISQILAIRKEEDKAKIYLDSYKEQVGLLKLRQRKQTGTMRHLSVYRGVNAEKRMFGTRNVYSDENKELYW